MTNQVIPDAAVEEVAAVLYDIGAHQSANTFEEVHSILRDSARQLLEAAAPHMRQAFFLEMNLRAVEDELNTPLQFGNANRGATP